MIYLISLVGSNIKNAIKALTRARILPSVVLRLCAARLRTIIWGRKQSSGLGTALVVLALAHTRAFSNAIPSFPRRSPVRWQSVRWRTFYWQFVSRGAHINLIGTSFNILSNAFLRVHCSGRRHPDGGLAGGLGGSEKARRKLDPELIIDFPRTTVHHIMHRHYGTVQNLKTRGDCSKIGAQMQIWTKTY